MSQYPYGYDPYRGQPPPPSIPPPPQGYTYPTTGYSQPPYDAQYESALPDRHYAVMTHESFAYNTSHIPGLGFGDSEMTGNGPPPPNAAGWGHGQSFVPPMPPTHRGPPAPPPIHHMPAMPAMPPGSNQYHHDNPPVDVYRPERAFSAPQRFSPLQPTPRRGGKISIMIRDDVEEGELNESQFQDLYEPTAGSKSPEPSPKSLRSPQTARRSRSASVLEAQATDFYEEDGEQGELASSRGLISSDTRRERTGSYSPYLSPREIQDDDPPADAQGTSEAPGSHKADEATSRTNLEEQAPGAPASTNIIHETSVRLTAANPQSPGGPPTVTTTTYPSFKTVAEAKKEAQKAILNLLPLGVRYQTYIDEGFDEKVVKSLFEELHFDVTKPPGVGPDANPQAHLPLPSSATHQSFSDIPAATEVSSHLPQPDSALPRSKSNTESQVSGGGAMADAPATLEERKDRIARRLAAKGAKPGAGAGTNGTTPASRPSNASGTVEAKPKSKAKAKTEKELLLQKKMDALRRSREARAQKAAAAAAQRKTSATADKKKEDRPVSSTAVQKTQENGPLDNPPAVDDSSFTTAPQPAPHTARSPLPPPPQETHGLTSIPGLSLPSTSLAPESSNQRKRPVASDFVDYTSAVGTLKRPFGQERSESSLVIDVSDGSDDEDVEMETESQGDAPAHIQRTGTPSRRGLSIRDFPPLTDTFPPRQFSSPISAAQTPPGRYGLVKKKETEYELKMKQIEEMRKQIAEMEAKQNTKKTSGGSQTPNKSVGTPPEAGEVDTSQPPTRRPVSTGGIGVSDRASAQATPEAPSTKLPKPSENRKLGRSSDLVLRERLVSLKLNRADADLQQKRSRLSQLREEIEKLEAEVEEGEAEKTRLTIELSQLEDTSRAEPTPANDSQPKILSVEPTEEAEEQSEKESVISVGSSEAAESSKSQAAEASPVASDSGTNSDEETQAMDIDTDSELHEGSSGQHPQPDEALAPRASAEANGCAEGITSPVAKGSDENGIEAVPDARQEEGEVEQPPPEGEATRPVPEIESALETKGTPGETLEPPRVVTEEQAGHVALESPPFSPAPVEAEPAVDKDDANLQETTDMASPKLAQISSATQPRQASQEAEEGIPREVDDVPSSESALPEGEATFVPYVSPLQYFHAYRFHPKYLESVAGGLKSLTYSNKIDPKRAICPSELDGEVCPRGDACEFQHFRNMVVPDDQILLELGRADDFAGDQKTRFIHGLRELLQNFRTNKVKDFGTIAHEIIEFRTRFLGDKSKILHLEGVSI